MGVRQLGVVAAFLCATSGAVFACSSFNGNTPKDDVDAGSTSPPGSDTPPPVGSTDSGVIPDKDHDAGDGGLTDAGYYFEDFEDAGQAFWVKPPTVLGHADIAPDQHHGGARSLHASSLMGNGARSAFWALDVPEPFVSIDVDFAVYLQTAVFPTEIVDIVDTQKNAYVAGLPGPSNIWSISEHNATTSGGSGAVTFGMPKVNDWVLCSIHIEAAGNKARMACGADSGELSRTLKPFSTPSGTTRLSFGILAATAQGDLFLDDIAVQVLR